MQLTNNFHLDEFTKSPTAYRLNIDNTPTQEVIYSLQELCTVILQPLRDAYGKPLKISSGYRCLRLNRSIGSSDRSDHIKGQAADIDFASKEEALEIYQRLDAINIKYTKLILEYLPNGWFHISYNPKAEYSNRILLKDKTYNYVKLEPEDALRKIKD